MTSYSHYHNKSMGHPSDGTPFRPSNAYPECPFGADCVGSRLNAVYGGIRETLRLTRLDAESYGTVVWNPLGAYIKPGMRMLVKPDLVIRVNPTGGGSLDSTSKAIGALGKRFTGDTRSERSWSGNGTIWRTVLDLNTIVKYANRGGVMRFTKQREAITVADKIVIGQGGAPLLSEPGLWGMLSFSDDSVESDVAMARLLGTDKEVIPRIGHAVSQNGLFRLARKQSCMVICGPNNKSYDGKPIDNLIADIRKAAKPTSGWRSVFKSSY